MINIIRLYENLKDIEVGMYVIAELEDSYSKLPIAINKGISNQIGEVVEIVKDGRKEFEQGPDKDSYHVKYDKIVLGPLSDFYKGINRVMPDKFKECIFAISRQDIKYFSSDKEALEFYLNINKYNL